MSTRSVPVHHPVRHPTPHVTKSEHFELLGHESSGPCALSISSGERLVQMRLKHADLTVFEGVWESRLTLDHVDVDPVGAWTNICSEINDQAAYMELELAFEGGVQIERQVFLARQDGFAFLADVVKCSEQVSGEYSLQLPLANSIRWEGDPESRDGLLMSGRRRAARVLPLSLPEWRHEPGGSLDVNQNRLELTLPVRGRRLHAAWFIDLDRRRSKQPCTWRRLTVGESLQIVPRDVAVGYRVQIGQSQWLFYRSLASCGNRSVLGQNFSTEFVAARFLKSGLTDKMLEIE